MRARRWRQRRRGHRGRFAHRDQRGQRGYRGRCGHRNCLAHHRRERRDRNKRQRRGNPPPKYEISLGRSSRHAVLHRQTRRFGHGSERCAAHHAPVRRIAAFAANTGSRAASRPYSERYPYQITAKPCWIGIRGASAYPTYRGIGKESVRASRNASGNGLQFHA